VHLQIAQGCYTNLNFNSTIGVDGKGYNVAEDWSEGLVLTAGVKTADGSQVG
jgi:hypothetical protein